MLDGLLILHYFPARDTKNITVALLFGKLEILKQGLPFLRTFYYHKMFYIKKGTLEVLFYNLDTIIPHNKLIPHTPIN